MSESPPPLSWQSRDDEDHLNLLAIFHFIGAGLALVGILFVFLHFTLMNSVLGNRHVWDKLQNQNSPQPPFNPPDFFAIFKFFYLFFALWFVASAVLNLLSGIYLRARRHRTFSTVVGAINCLHLPLGTVLGVFTLVVLSRPSVRALYDAQAVKYPGMP